MKRTALIAALLLGLFCFVCGAQETGFRCEYTPKSAKSSAYYIDVISEREITAAVFTLDYDNSFSSFRSVQSSVTGATMRNTENAGRVSVAFAAGSAVSGRLCRLYFQALSEGETNFILRVTQTADAFRTGSSATEEYTLTVRFDKDDVAASSGGSSRSASSFSASSKSSKRTSSSVGDEPDDENAAVGGVFDLRRDHAGTYLFIGAGGMLLIAAAIVAVIYFVRRKKAVPSPDSEQPSGDKISPDEMQKLIDELNDEAPKD